MKSRRLVAFAAALAAAALALTGCSAGGGTDNTSSGKVTLTFWHHTYPGADKVIKSRIASFEKANPNVTIKFEDIPAGAYNTRLSAAIAAKATPDIVNLLDYSMPAYEGILAPATPKSFGVSTTAGIANLYQPGVLDGLTSKGKIYMLPEELDTMELFLNKKIFADAGLDASDPSVQPKTWSDLFALSKKLTKTKGGVVTQIGFNWVFNLDPFWYAQQYTPILAQYGCNVFDKHGKATIDSPACVKAFTQTWEQPIKDGIAGPSIGESNAVNGLQSFSDGKQAMAVGGPWAPSSFEPGMQDNYVVAPFPQLNPSDPKTMLYTYGLAVTKASPHASTAWKFINYLLSDSNDYLKDAGYINGRKGWDTTPAGKALIGKKVWLEGISTGVYTWRSKNWLQQGTDIKKAIEAFSSGSMSVKQALTQAADQINSGN